MRKLLCSLNIYRIKKGMIDNNLHVLSTLKEINRITKECIKTVCRRDSYLQIESCLLRKPCFDLASHIRLPETTKNQTESLETTEVSFLNRILVTELTLLNWFKLNLNGLMANK